MGVRGRVGEFCERYGLRLPIVQAPMAGACPPESAIAVAEAGGMGSAGVVLDSPERIADWAARFRAGSAGPFQLNIWIPDYPAEDAGTVARQAAVAREFLGRFGGPGEPGGAGPGFEEQCEAMLAAAPAVVSSIMGLFPPEFVKRLAERGIGWFACATTLDEALAAQEAGADAIVAQGVEAGGHRGTFDPDSAERTAVGLFALLPRLADHLRVPIIAAGGIADGRGMAAALALGASAVQVGTALLRCPETAISKEWSSALDGLAPEATLTTRAYSGRLGRAAPTPYVRAWSEPEAPTPARYPTQRQLVAQWRRGTPDGLDRVNVWAGQSAAMAREEPAGEVVTRMWRDASALLATD
ncbi:MAG TPA: nitronate monooxygenase [Pseudonocardia sp.]|uniref:NAD(P)H-dependent flavin oxidoreductase n=1 Tax=Pseudonocardia sp. TaxID=60912 RepID=UPI002C8C5D9D|nr:nitronate monooxygenase [Pseudonocardia sp.]HTF54878.1 nitronate monooxygenase [Pseudonocardia sp.]